MTDISPCDPDIFANGVPVAIVAGDGAMDIEEYVVMIAEKSGQLVDWHYAAGRGRILTTGDIAKVKLALVEHPPMQLRIL